METDEANALLPQRKTKAVADPAHLKYLMITPPKWGKTTFMCSVPDSILLAFEEGHAFHETHKIVIDCWDRGYSDRKDGWGEDDDGNAHTSFAEAVEAIVASDRFQFVVIDTADMAAKMCLDYHYKKLGVTHASDAGDYGKGWDLALTQPYRLQVGALMKAGRGIGFITHSNLVTKKVGRVETSRWETTLPSQVQKFLHTQADVILHGSFGKKRKGMEDRDRVISMDGSNEILAGSRVRGIHLPPKYVVDPIEPWQQWASFFGENGPAAVSEAEEYYTKFVIGGQEVEAQQEAEAATTEVSSAVPAKEPATEGTTASRKGASRRRR